MRILFIEDTIPLAQSIIRYLSLSDIQVTLITGGREWYTRALQADHDIILLDLGLPGMDGEAICRELRREGITTPILMLTSRSTMDDRVGGLELGADDYMTKPCDMRELIARLHALSRREHSHKWTKELRYGALVLDPERKQVSLRWVSIELSSREFDLLLFFVQHVWQVVSKTLIAEKVWWIYDVWTDPKVVEVYIGYLRKKIPGVIETHKWVGYEIAPVNHFLT